jgi:hypothetical protein
LGKYVTLLLRVVVVLLMVALPWVVCLHLCIHLVHHAPPLAPRPHCPLTHQPRLTQGLQLIADIFYCLLVLCRGAQLEGCLTDHLLPWSWPNILPSSSILRLTVLCCTETLTPHLLLLLPL